MKSNNALTSSVLMISASWIAKSLGLLSTIILARLLTPEDFGLVAITMLVVYFLDVFSQTGSQQYLLSKKEVGTDDLNTAWSLTVLIRIVLCIILLLSANPIANWLEADIAIPLRVCALLIIVIGLKNPAVSLYKRELNYSSIFKLALLTKFFSFTVTITIAYFYRSYWALIIGTICHFSFSTIGSYIIYPYKPKFCFINFRNQWEFSKWVLLRGFVGYSRSKGDAFLIAKFFSTTDVGIFSIAKDLAMLIYEQIALPIAEIIMTSVQKAKANKQNIDHVIEKYLLILISLICPIACILSLLTDSIVLVILGEKWLEAAPVLMVLTLLGISTSLTVVFNSTLTALKLTKLSFKIDLVTTAIILSTLVLLKNVELVDFALIRTLLDLLVFLSYLLFAKFIVGLHLRTAIVNIIPTMLAAIIMALSLHQLSLVLVIDSFLMLATVCALTTIIYAIALYTIINVFPYKGDTLLGFKDTMNKVTFKLIRMLLFFK